MWGRTQSTSKSVFKRYIIRKVYKIKQNLTVATKDRWKLKKCDDAANY